MGLNDFISEKWIKIIIFYTFTDSKQKIKDEIPKSVIVLWSDAPMAKFMSSVRPRALLGTEYLVFSPLIPSKPEKNISVLLI